jgi:hypothetical protein
MFKGLAQEFNRSVLYTLMGNFSMRLNGTNMYTVKEQQEFFVQRREGLMKLLLARAIKNNVKVTLSSYGGHPGEKDGLYYNVGGVNLRYDCNISQYSYARKRLSEKIKIKRVAELAEELRRIKTTYHDGESIIQAAALASRINL